MNLLKEFAFSLSLSLISLSYTYNEWKKRQFCNVQMNKTISSTQTTTKNEKQKEFLLIYLYGFLTSC